MTIHDRGIFTPCSLSDSAVNDILFVGFFQFRKQDGTALFTSGEVGTQVIRLGNGNIEEFLKSGNDAGKGDPPSVSIRNKSAIVQRGNKFHEVDKRAFPMER